MIRAVLAALAITASTQTSTPPPPTLDSVPANVATGPVYLALGDSAPMWNGNESYPNLIGGSLSAAKPGLEVVNMSVSGATTTSFLSGPNSQERKAETILRDHGATVQFVTIDIGGNDELPCSANLANPGPCLAGAEIKMAHNLKTILKGLRAEAPTTVPIYSMTYYNPFLGAWLGGPTDHALVEASIPILRHLNDLLIKTYRSDGIKVADVAGSFHEYTLSTRVPSKWGRIPLGVRDACNWLDIFCQAGYGGFGGDDPTILGARVIAGAFEALKLP